MMRTNCHRQVCYIVVFSFATLIFFARGSKAEQPENLLSYPSTSLIEPKPLGAEQRSVLGKLFEQNISADVLAKRTTALCSKPILHSAADHEFTKKSVTNAEASLITEVLFERDGEKGGIELEPFSDLVQFERSKEIARHLSPLLQGDGGGFRVPMAPSSTRALRLEGKLGADVVAFVAPLYECSHRAVALCPRRFTKNDEMLRSRYSAKGVRPIFNLKADGVLAPPAGSTGKIVTSLLASSGVSIPGEWSKIAEGSGTISQEVAFSLPNDERRASRPLLTLGASPLNFAIESRIDLGQQEKPLRRTSARIDVEISTVKVGDFYDIELGTSVLSVEGGDCVLIVESGEEVV